MTGNLTAEARKSVAIILPLRANWSKKVGSDNFRVQKYREAKISFEPYEKMLADERKESSQFGDNGGGTNSGTEGEVHDIVADKSDIGSGSTYSRLHKVMLAAGFDG